MRPSVEPPFLLDHVGNSADEIPWMGSGYLQSIRREEETFRTKVSARVYFQNRLLKLKLLECETKFLK